MSGSNTEGTTEGNKLGVRPKRIRGYYRALKRKELWAVEISKLTPLQRLYALTYGHYIDTLLKSSSNFLRDRVFKSDWSCGSISIKDITKEYND